MMVANKDMMTTIQLNELLMARALDFSDPEQSPSWHINPGSQPPPAVQ